MKLAPAQLAKHLQGNLAPVYIVSGDDPLLCQEAADSIRQAQQEHEELVHLCRSGDVRAAAALLKRHIEHACKDLERFILSQRR